MTATHFAPQKASLAGYDYSQGARIQATQRKVSGGSSDGLAAHLAQKQHDYFIRDMNISAYTGQAAGEAELNEMAQLQAAAADAGSTTYSGVSYEPLGVGRAFIVMEGQVEYRLVAVSVQHHSDNHGNYHCEFTAIPADVAAPPYTDPHCYARAEAQPAKVYDNNDPQGLGRIKVLFHWGTGGSKETDWIRMVQPHSGGGKGFYFVPEKGEEVLVGFKGGNAEKPYIIGTQYNGKQSSGYSTPDNDRKVIHTRSGTKIMFNDAEGSVFIEDPSGNTWLMDGKGNIKVHAPKDIIFTAGKNITMTAGMNITSSAGMNISESAGIDHISSAGAMMMQNAVADYSLMAANITEVAQGEKKAKAKEINESANSKEVAVQGNNNWHTQGEFNNNSGENSKSH